MPYAMRTTLHGIRNTMRKTLLLFCLIGQFTLLAQQPRYARARIALDSPAGGIQQLAALGLAIDHAVVEPGIAITAELSEEELAIARAHGFPVEELITDVRSFYLERAHEASAPVQRGGQSCNAVPYYPTPQNFTLGSMGGYFTWEEMQDQLDAMRAAYPQLITEKDSIGTTHEGRPIHLVRMSNDADVDQDKPELLYTALHHAREPVSLSQLIFFMWHLLENYGTDAEATYVLDHFELCFVPCINPDGYVYNATTDPSGGGMWRKNRRDNGNGSFGVDLNRNYAQGWGIDDQGSSGNSSSDVYRGPSAFSEPETQAIRDLCNAHEFRLALNYHAHGNLLIYPWGYGFDLYTPDSAHFVEAGLHLTNDNRYRFGTANQTVYYVVNGGSDDWMYGEQQTKPKIMSCTPECGGPPDWFWPPIWRIEEICRENVRHNLRAAELCGVLATVSDRGPAFLSTANAHARFAVNRIGMEQGPITVSVVPGANMTGAGAAITYADLGLPEERIDSITISLAANVQPGDWIEYDLVVTNGQLSVTEHVRKPIGTEVTLFSDDCSSLTNWNTDFWGIEPASGLNGGACITDSPFMFYESQTVNSLELADPIDLANSVSAQLTFMAKWDIEGQFDGVQVFASDDGSAWTPMCGRFAHPGYPDQGAGVPVLDGQMPDWAQEEIDLSAFCGGQLWLRWVFGSNAAREHDGFWLDEVRVVGTQLNSGISAHESGGGFNVWPNPADDALYLRLASADRVHIAQLMDARGARVFEAPVHAGQARIGLGGIASGTYAVRLLDSTGAVIGTQRAVVLH